MRKLVKMPDILSNPVTLSNLLHITKKVIDQVDIQNQYSRIIHTSFQHLSNDIQKCSIYAESKLNTISGINSLVCKQVIKIMYTMFRHLEQQSFKNQITLKTIAKTEKQEPLFKSIQDKHTKIKQKTQDYIKLYSHYQQVQLQYIQKSKKFQNVGNNPVKYYSLEVYDQRISKIAELQDQLKKTLDRLRNQQASIQVVYRQIRKLLIEFFSNKIKRMYEIITLGRQVISKIMTFQEIIIEEGSKDYLTNASEKPLEQYVITSSEQAIDVAKKILQKQGLVRQIFEQYLMNIKKSLQSYKKQLVDSQLSPLVMNLNRQKKIIQNAFGDNLYYNKISSDSELKKFCGFLQKLMSRIQIDKTILRYRKIQQDLLQRLQKQIKSMNNNFSASSTTKQDPEKRLKFYSQMKTYIKRKYVIQAENMNSQFKEDVLILIKQLKQLRQGFLTQFQPYQKPQSSRIQTQIQNILKSEFYKVLFHPFIIQQNDLIFQRSPHVTSFVQIKNQQSNNMANISGDIQDNQRKITEIFLNKALCCSSIQRDEKFIDNFNCALINGILLQGKLSLFKHEIKFVSFFNKYTLFGKTKLRIPSKDILNVGKVNNSINTIFIETTHGVLKFSSFLSDPLVILRYHYVSNKIRIDRQSKKQQQRQSKKQSQRQGEQITKEPKSKVFGLSAIKLQVINHLNEMGFNQIGADKLYRSYTTDNKRIMETITIRQKYQQSLKGQVIYSIQNSIQEKYYFMFYKTRENKTSLKCESTERVQIFKNNFIDLLNIITKTKQKQHQSHNNSKSEVSSSSSKQDDKSHITNPFKSQKSINLLAEKSLFESRYGQETCIDKSYSNINPTSRISFNQVVAHHPLQKSVIKYPKSGILKDPSPVEQEFNPLVFYIVLGIIVFSLAIVI